MKRTLPHVRVCMLAVTDRSLRSTVRPAAKWRFQNSSPEINRGDHDDYFHFSYTVGGPNRVPSPGRPDLHTENTYQLKGPGVINYVTCVEVMECLCS